MAAEEPRIGGHLHSITCYGKGGAVPPSSRDPVSGWWLRSIEDVMVIRRLLEARHGKDHDLLISQLRRYAERGTSGRSSRISKRVAA